METYVVWPDLWLTVAFIAACAVLIVTAVGREKILKAGNLISEMLTNRSFLWVMSILLLLGGFIVTLCLLHFCNADEYVFVGYIIVTLIFPALVAACLADSRGYEYIYSFLFAYAAGQSVVGMIFLVCCHFSYMWYLLGFLILDIIGIFLAEECED